MKKEIQIFGLLMIEILLIVVGISFVNAAYTDNGSLAQNVDDCGTLNTTNAVYTLINNVTSNSTCFSIGANNITLDGNGYTINYSANGTSGYAAYSSFNMTTIKNSIIKEGNSATSYKYGIYIFGGNNASILNNSIFTIGSYSHPIYFKTNSNNGLIAYNIIRSTNTGGSLGGIYFDTSLNANITQNNISVVYYSWGIYFKTSSNCFVTNNNVTASGTSSIGFYLLTSSNNNQIDDNVIRSTTGLYVSSSSNNNLNRNNITSFSGSGVYILTSTNNSFYNNNVTATASKSFSISGTSVSHFNHTLGNDNKIDGLPLNYTFAQDNLNFNAINFSQYGQTIFASLNNLTITNSNFTANGLSLYLVTNSTINNNNITTSKNWDDALNVYMSNGNSIKNNFLLSASYSHVLYLNTNSNGNIVDNNTVRAISTDNPRCIDVLTSSNNNISNNKLFNSATWSAHGIVLGTTSNGNNVINNSISLTGGGGGSTFGIWISGSSNNIIDNASVSTAGSNAGYGIYLNSGSLNNTINNSNIQTTGGGSSYGIYAVTSQITASIINTIINASGTTADVYADSSTSAGSWLNFINVSFNKSKTTISSNLNLNVSWYLDVNTTTNQTGAALAGANVSAWNTNGNLLLSQLTENNGLLGTTLLEYNQNSTNTTYFSFYTINITKSGYASYSNATINATTNLRITNGLIDISPQFNFLSPTQSNNTFINASSTEINVSISELNLNEVKYNWNGTNFTLYNDSLILMMNFDNNSAIGENSTYAVDVSKYGNNGSCSGTACPIWNSSGKYGGAMQFDGVDDRVDIPDLYSTNVTFSTWIKYSNNSGWNNYYIFDGLATSYFVLKISNSTKKLYFDTHNSDTNSLSSLTTLNENTWYYATVTYNNGNKSIYLNGIFENSSNGLSANPRIYAIGINIDEGASWYYPFNGSIDSVQIWNRSLSAAEVYQLYASNLYKYNSTQWYLSVNQSKNATAGLDQGKYTYFASAKDVVGNENVSDVRTITFDTNVPSGTLNTPLNNSYGNNATQNFTINISDNIGVKNATLNINAVSGGSNWLDFDGVDDYVGFGTNPTFANEMTISVWLKTNSIQNNYNGVISRYAAWSLYFLPNTRRLSFFGNWYHDPLVQYSLPDDSWHYIVAKQNSSNMTFLYVDGLEVNTTQQSLSIDNIGSNIYIGKYYDGGYFFNGSIDEVRIYNRSLSSSEISQIYNSGRIANSSLNATGLVAWYDFESGNNLAQLIDKAAGLNNGTITGGATWGYTKTTTFSAGVVTSTLGVVVTLVDGVYKWFYDIFDFAGNRVTTTNYTATVDSTYPLINFANSTLANNTFIAQNNIFINVSVTDVNPANITFNLFNSSGALNKTKTYYAGELPDNQEIYNGINMTGNVLLMHFNNDSSVNENSTWVYDFSGRGNNGTLVSGTIINSSNSKYGPAGAYFDGNNDWINLSNSSSLQLSNGTVTAWVKTSLDTYGFWRGIVTKQWAYGIFANESGSLAIWDWGASQARETSMVIDDNTWHFVAFTFQSGINNGTHVYGDGRDLLTTNITISNQNYAVEIGRGGAGDVTSRQQLWNGSIDEVAIWNRSLSAAEISAIYNLSAPKYSHNFTGLSDGLYKYNVSVFDLAGNSNTSITRNITLDNVNPVLNLSTPLNNSYVNNATQNFTINITDNIGVKNATLNIIPQGTGNNWLDFDRVDDWVSVTGIPSLKNYSVSIWVKDSQPDYRRYYLDFRVSGGDNTFFLCNWQYSTLQIGLQLVYSQSIIKDRWYNFIVVNNDTQSLLYADGVNNSNGSSLGNIGNFYMSSRYSLTDLFNGSIDEVRIYNRSLSASEISAIYNSGRIANSSLNNSGLVAWYDFESGNNLTQLVDRANGFNNGTISGATWGYTKTTTYSAGVVTTTLGVVVTLVDGIYKWFYNVFDWTGNQVVTGNNTVIVDTTYPQISFVSGTPENNSGAQNFIANVSINELNLANITYNWNGSSFNYGGNYSLTSPVNLTSGLVLLMGMDNESILGEGYNNSNGTIIVDTSGSGNNGTLYFGSAGNGNYTTGRYGGAYNFDGRDDYVNLGNNSILNFSNAMTISSWVYPVSNGTYRTIASRYKHFSTPKSLDWLLRYDNQQFKFFIGNSTVYTSAVDSSSLNPYQWYHVVGTYDGSVILLYVNAVQKASANQGSMGQTDVNTYIGISQRALDGGTNEWFNGTIDEVMIWNRSLSADEIRQLYQSKVRKYFSTNETYLFTDFNNSAGNSTMKIESDDNINWRILVNQSAGLGVGMSYNYFVRATDLSGNVNSTETRTISGNSKPSFVSIVNTPSDLDSLDPGVMLNITANVSDIDNNFDSAILQWKNSSIGSDWNNITMDNSTAKSYYTLMIANFSLPLYETNVTYRIWVNDNVGDSNYSVNYYLNSSWDCTWISTPNLEAVAGWDQNKWIGNITINNTGDPEYANNNCSLDFRLTYNLDEGRIYFDNIYYKPSGTYTLAAKANTTISVNATFLSEIKQENFAISVNEISSRSNTSSRNVSAILITNQNGPYLYQRITSSPASVYLTSGNFSLQSYVRNLMGSSTVNENNTAYNVSAYWILPTGFFNLSGNLTNNYTNISDNNLYSNNIYVDFLDLASMTYGIKTFYLNSLGYNFSNDLIKDVNNITILNSSINITFLCYSTPDGVVVSDCGSLDGDYVAPVTEVTTTTTTSGGGGGGSGGGGGGDNYFAKFVKSDQRFELVRGKDNSFILTFDNPYPATALKNLKVSLTGLLSEYISISPSAIDYLEGGKSIKINAEIKAPKYFTEGVYNLSLLMKGKTVVNDSESPFEVKKSITLRIFELSRGDAENMLSEISGFISEMNQSGFMIREINNLFFEMNSSFNDNRFSNLKAGYDAAKLVYDNAISADNQIKDMQKKLEDARLNGIKTPETSKIVLMSEAAFVRGDYATAIDRLKEAKLSYALEVKGEFNLMAYVKRNPVKSSGIAVFAALLIVSSSILLRYKLLKIKLKILSEEETLLIGLMKVVQKECFENGKMSMEEYENTMTQYELRLNVVISDKIETETQLANILKLARGKEIALRTEEKRLKDLIKETQQLYFEKGKLETRIYENMLKSYGRRLSEIEEKLATLEAERELRKKGFHLRLR